ncbi:hypothetical protein [Candidatus Pelagibacter sp. RS40]|uniref:hypothetical protein n=1 Tax=Candidatus Pelagibacter sp. RS40 TaxID=1977865 RepID=UPI000A15B8D0|nr:hypothetical protein [Candidatus Pelagibacter sp. RS40]ARJ49468.1 hypothetical protein B8063_05490 [Candidatus Pelagibacter sp. RS40]
MRSKFYVFVDKTLFDLGRQFKWSYLPPLMIYVAAGISGLTGIVGTFFVKDYLNLSAAFLAGLGFWAGIPWALKMPLGHLVDLIWNKKNYMVFVGASLISLSLLIMYGLIIHTEWMSTILTVETWFVISVLLSPIGYVVQDVVADAMTVEAVPLVDDDGENFSRDEIKLMHTTMQTLGRFAIIGGTVLVALANVILFKGVDNLEQTEKISLYGSIYIYALIIPIVSVMGIFLASFLKSQKRKKLIQKGFSGLEAEIPKEKTEINWWILGGSLLFVIFTLSVGSFRLPFAQEIVFLGSMIIILFLMNKLIKELPKDLRLTVVGTAIIIFIFRAMPGPGPGLSWFEIDVLEFNEQFFSVLSLIASVLTLVGIIVLRPFMANNSIAKIIIILSIAGAVLFLPSVGMYYGFHNWTSSITNGVVDAKFIAIFNTALESPLGQVSMIPLLAWIAKNAPAHLKATFFAVFASFTNLALSASSLGTKYLNEIFTITREVKDKVSNAILTTADYSELGLLLITVTLLTLLIPVIFVNIIQKTKFKTDE